MSVLGLSPVRNPSTARRRRFLGVCRRVLTRALSRLPDIAYAPPEVGPVTSERGKQGRVGTLSGRFWLAVEQPHRAQRSFERALRHGDPRALVGLGQALLTGGPIGVDVIEQLGLVTRPAGDPLAAQQILESASGAASRSTTIERATITASLQMNRLDEAADRARRSTDCSDLLADASIRSMKRSPRSSRTDLAAVVPLLVDHLDRHPNDASAQDRLARVYLSLLEFDSALAITRTAPPPRITHEIALWTRSTAAGDHVAAHRTKQRAASDLARARARRTGSVGELVLRLQAINYRFGPEAALADLDRRWLMAPTELEQMIRTKLRADLKLLCGDPRPLRSLAPRYPSTNTTADERFRSIVAGKNVLVVGPSPAHQPDQAVVDAHDTVVTTGRPFAFTGDRRDSIVYLNNEWFLAGRHRGGTNPDDPRPLTVLRPSIVRHTSAADRDDANTRVQPFEDSTPLFSTHFALQRILHDLIANEAATVTIAGVDFFLGPEQYVDGYHEGSADRFANVPFNFSHDFTYAFWYTKRLRDHGLIAASGTLGTLLDHSVEWYMNHLGRVFL